MRIQLKPEKIAEIKDAFARLQKKEDLLDLLNSVADIQEYWYSRAPRLTIDQTISLLELFREPSLSIEDSFSALPKRLITQKQLDFFSSSFDIKEKKRNRYVKFKILKKSGSLREIKAPLPKLKEIQRALNTILQSVYTTQEQAFGFVPGKNIADNAAAHAGASFILNVDIKDFFPSIHFRRIKRMLEKEPFNLKEEKEPLAFLIANLCTEEGTLPQGAPTSPLFTNIICQRLDKRLQQLAGHYKAAYTRYADDITFSCTEYIFTKRFMQRLEKILKNDRFELNPEKTRVQGKAFRQEVTGLTVNEKVNVSRGVYRSYRTLLHLYKTKGAEKALEYHFKRMPASVLFEKKKKKIKDVDLYMKNVIWGKYYFIKMIKKDASLKPPFEVDSNLLRLGDGNFIRKSSIDILKKEKVKGDTHDKEKSEIKVPPLISGIIDIFAPADEVQPDSDRLIENVLNTWEAEAESDGFKKAMDILKQKLDEQ